MAEPEKRPDTVVTSRIISEVAVVQYPFRGLIVRQGSDQFVVSEVRLEYRWRGGQWEFQSVLGFGFRRLPGGGGRTGTVWKQVTGSHPDYQLLAEQYRPTWAPRDV